jgi:hypothetical protein
MSNKLEGFSTTIIYWLLVTNICELGSEFPKFGKALASPVNI